MEDTFSLVHLFGFPSSSADPASALKGPRLNYVLGNLGVVNLSGYFLLSGDFAFLRVFPAIYCHFPAAFAGTAGERKRLLPSWKVDRGSGLQILLHAALLCPEAGPGVCSFS